MNPDPVAAKSSGLMPQFAGTQETVPYTKGICGICRSRGSTRIYPKGAILSNPEKFCTPCEALAASTGSAFLIIETVH
jgi:hypothetical protein